MAKRCRAKQLVEDEHGLREVRCIHRDGHPGMHGVGEHVWLPKRMRLHEELIATLDQEFARLDELLTGVEPEEPPLTEYAGIDPVSGKWVVFALPSSQPGLTFPKNLRF